RILSGSAGPCGARAVLRAGRAAHAGCAPGADCRQSTGRSRVGPHSPLRDLPGVEAAMTTLHADLMTIADSVRILGPSRYEILDQTRDVADQRGDAEPLIEVLADDLYETLYLRPSQPGGPRGGVWLAQREYLTALSTANRGTGTWEPGWTIRRSEGD